MGFIRFKINYFVWIIIELDDGQGCQADADQVLRRQVHQSAKVFETQFMSNEEQDGSISISQPQMDEIGDNDVLMDDLDLQIEEEEKQNRLKRLQKTPKKGKRP